MPRLGHAFSGSFSVLNTLCAEREAKGYMERVAGERHDLAMPYNPIP